MSRKFRGFDDDDYGYESYEDRARARDVTRKNRRRRKTQLLSQHLESDEWD